jgi:hypothetical protein
MASAGRSPAGPAGLKSRRGSILVGRSGLDIETRIDPGRRFGLDIRVRSMPVGLLGLDNKTQIDPGRACSS